MAAVGESNKRKRDSIKSKPVKPQSNAGSKKDPKPSKFKPVKPAAAAEAKKESKTPRERHLAAKEVAEERKKKRSKLVSEALRKMDGKFLEIASSHVSARVLQTCVKYGSPAEREMVHLVKKLLDNATRKQFEAFISSLHGHVSSLLRHTMGSVVVDHAYQLAKGSQKQRLLMEMYSTELHFKDLTLTNSGMLVDVISKLGLQKSSVLQHMSSVI